MHLQTYYDRYNLRKAVLEPAVLPNWKSDYHNLHENQARNILEYILNMTFDMIPGWWAYINSVTQITIVLHTCLTRFLILPLSPLSPAPIGTFLLTFTTCIAVWGVLHRILDPCD